MALNRVHTSAKAADVAELLLLNKCRITRPSMQTVVVNHPTVIQQYFQSLCGMGCGIYQLAYFWLTGLT